MLPDSSGDITASFHLLGRFPAKPNPMYELIASNQTLCKLTTAVCVSSCIRLSDALWIGEPTFAPLVFTGIHKIIGILGTLLMQRPDAKTKYAPFLRESVNDPPQSSHHADADVATNRVVR